MKKSILITGVSGMIGSAVAKQAIKEGYEVIGSARNNHSLLSKELEIKIINIDFDSAKVVIPKVNFIIHCATANDIESVELKKGVNLSLFGTNKIFENISKQNLDRFIFISTAQIYGKELRGKYNEESIPKCHNYYSLNHIFGEELCKMYANIKAIKSTIIRPTNVYGIPTINTVKRETLVPNCFVISLIKNGEINMRSSGLQMRDFIHQEELANKIIKELENSKEDFKIKNACSGSSFEIREIAKICLKKYEKIFKKKGYLNFLSKEPLENNKFNFETNDLQNKKNCVHYARIEDTIEKLFIFYRKKKYE